MSKITRHCRPLMWYYRSTLVYIGALVDRLQPRHCILSMGSTRKTWQIIVGKASIWTRISNYNYFIYISYRSFHQTSPYNLRLLHMFGDILCMLWCFHIFSTYHSLTTYMFFICIGTDTGVKDLCVFFRFTYNVSHKYRASYYIFLCTTIKLYIVDFPVVICNAFCQLPPQYTT